MQQRMSHEVMLMHQFLQVFWVCFELMLAFNQESCLRRKIRFQLLETDIWYACLRVPGLAGEDRDFFAVQWQAAWCKRACCVCWRGDMGASASAGVGLCAGYTQQEGSPL